MSDKTGYDGWSILEVMGHRKLGGYVRVDPPEMPGLYRIDVFTDGDSPVATQYYNPSAIFALTPTAEAVARSLARTCEVKPVARWELAAPEPAPALRPIDSQGGYEEYDPDDMPL